MPSSELPYPLQKEILNVDEAAAYLGVSTRTFNKVLHEGEMPGRKIGREWKFSRRALEAWVADAKSVDFLNTDDANAEEEAEEAAAAAPPAASAPPAAAPRRPAARTSFHADED